MSLHKMQELKDCDVYKVLDWLYVRRDRWVTAEDFVFSKQDILQVDLNWLVAHGLLLSQYFDMPDGRKVEKYRISPGGIMERANRRHERRMEYLTFSLAVISVLIAFGALCVSVLDFLNHCYSNSIGIP